MRDEIKFTLYCLGLGMILISYAHSQFASKEILSLIFDKLNRIDTKVQSIEEHLRSR